MVLVEQIFPLNFPTKTHNWSKIPVSGYVQGNSVLTEIYWKAYLKRQQSSDNGKVFFHHDTCDPSRISPASQDNGINYLAKLEPSHHYLVLKIVSVNLI